MYRISSVSLGRIYLFSAYHVLVSKLAASTKVALVNWQQAHW